MKKILSLFLCLCMLFSLSTVALAGESTQAKSPLASLLSFYAAYRKSHTVNYVALGDSTAAGYYMNDYHRSYLHNTNRENVSSAYSEYAQFKSYLQCTGNRVKGTDLTLNSMRPSELRAILDSSYYTSAVVAGKEDSLCLEYLPYYCEAYGTYTNLHNTFTKAIESADVITCDMLSGDFGLYFTDHLSELLSGGFQDSDYQSEYECLMRREGYPALADSAAVLNHTLRAALNGTGLADNELVGTLDLLVDLLLYCYAHCVINFSKAVDWIYGLNEDVTLIIVGPYNPLTRLVGTYHGIEVNFGKLWDCLSEAITAYVVKVDSHADQYLFADCSAGVNSFIDDFAEGRFLDSGYKNYRSMFYKYTNIDSESFVSGADLIQLSQNIQDACNAPVELENLIKVFSLDAKTLQAECQKAALVNTTRGAELSGEDITFSKTALLASFVTQERSCGYHPGVSGYLQKAVYIIKAYKRSYTADNTYFIRVSDLAKKLAVNFIGSAFGFESSRNSLQAVLTQLFTPIIRIDGLFTK